MPAFAAHVLEDAVSALVLEGCVFARAGLVRVTDASDEVDEASGELPRSSISARSFTAIRMLIVTVAVATGVNIGTAAVS